MFSDTATVEVSVTGPNNQPPAFANSTYNLSVPADTASYTVVGSLAATDPEGDPLSFWDDGFGWPFTVTSIGDVEFSGLVGELTAGDTYSLTATVDDDWGDDIATVNITVTGPVNQPPVFASPTFTIGVLADTASYSAIGTLAATDLEGDPLSFWDDGTGWPFTVLSSGDVEFAGSLGELTPGDIHTFTATVSDAWGSDTADVTVVVHGPQNLPPFFSQDSYVFDVYDDIQPYTVVGTLPATDPENDPLTYWDNGAGLFVVTNGQLEFVGTPGSLTAGELHTMTATVEDQWGADTAQVHINVLPSYSDPGVVDAVDDIVPGSPGSPLELSPLANDFGPGIYITSATSADGTLTLLDTNSDGYADTIDFQSWPYLTESALLEYTITDQAGNSDDAVIFVVFNQVLPNDPPVYRISPQDLRSANSYNFDFYLGMATVGSVYATDFDGDLVRHRSPFGVAPFTVLPNGIVVPTRHILQTEIGDVHKITAIAEDGRGGSDSARVTIAIKSPVKAVNDTFTMTYEEAAASVIESQYSVLGNDYARYGAVDVQLVQQAQHGIVEVEDDGFFTYTRSTQTFQPDSFQYRLTDLVTGVVSNVATVTLNAPSLVQPLPPVLEAIDDTFDKVIDATSANYAFASVVTNDTIPLGQLTVTQLTQPHFGTVALAADGTSFTYTPNNQAFHSVTETFQYRITVNESSSVAAVHIRFSEPAPAGPVGPVHGQSPPQFGYPYYVMRYTNAPVLGDTTATDADGDNLTYALHSAPPWIAGAKVNNNTFRIQVAAGATPVIGVHTFQAVVEDGNLSGSGQPQGDAATVVVIVDPAGNGSAPVFSSNTYNVTLTLQQLQDATPGSLIATNQFVTANDPQNQTVTYSTPTSGASFGNPISVHPTTGEVFVNVSGILEPNSNRAIVIAEDPDHYTDTAEIVVTVQGLTGYQLYVQGAGDSHEIAGNDVQQGGLGNCWFQSVLAAIADQSPQVIQAMIVDEGNFDFKVRFFQKNAAGQLAPIWVDVHFNPQGTSGVAVGADIDAAGNAEIWPRIVEAAYIQFVGGPANVTGGTPATSWEMITGYPANPTQPANSLNAVLLQQLLNAGQLVWVGTKPGPILVGGLAPNHIYNVVSYDAQTGFVTLANPHGTNHSTMTLADLLTAIQEWWRQ